MQIPTVGRSWIALPLAVSLLAIAACNRTSKEGMTMPDIVISASDLDRTLDLRVGARAVVRLPWSPGTGYDWVLAKGDSVHLPQDGEAASEPNPQPMPGAPEVRIFRFRAAKAGTAALEFHSRRVWEKDVPPVSTFRVQVRIAE